MGADLTIENKPSEKMLGGFEVSDKAVKSGYFRDCYNPYGLFWVMRTTLKLDSDKLSWWILTSRDTKDTEKYERADLFERDDNCTVMTVEGVKVWLAELEPIVEQFLNAKVLITDVQGKYDPKTHRSAVVLKRIAWEKRAEYYRWAKSLLTFLKIAIKCESRIRFSV